MSDLHHDHLYIGGNWVAPATDGRISVISPMTEQELGSTPEGRPPTSTLRSPPPVVHSTATGAARPPPSGPT
jgi:hypothetical protein